MKLRLLLPFTVCLCLSGGNKAYGQEQEIRKAVTEQMRIYPKSTLRDLYKNFFQDRFGPGHIIGDTTAADAYLREELATAGRFDGLLYEPTGYEGNFYRVNLSLVKDRIVPYGVYFDAFVRSVNGIRSISVGVWKEEWRLINSVISGMTLHLDGYEQDSLEIDNLLEQGKYVMHHSRAFTETYDLHYRIIGKEIFEEEILPLIEKNSKKEQQ